MGKRGKKTKSARRLKYEAAIAAGKSNVEAGREAGYSPNTIDSMGGKMAAPIRASMAEAFRNAGNTEDLIAKKVRKLFDNKDGNVQLRAAHITIQVLDGYPAPKEKVEDSRPITIVFGKSLSSMMPVEKKQGA